VTAIIDAAGTCRSLRRIARTRAWLGVLAASLLVRCAPEAPTTESLLVVPGYYDTLDCRELTERVQKSTRRATELEKLRERSAGGAGGSVVNVLAYDTDFAKARAEQRNATEAATRKGCDLNAPAKPLGPGSGAQPAPKPPR
jgi:hypothetical protein